MPLPGFSESERNIITNAAEPIHPSHRGAFLEAVANALASYPVLGEGIVPAEELYRPAPAAVLDGEQVFPSRQHVSRLAGLLTMALWSAIRLQPNRERLALNELARAGYETYCPRILHRIRSNTGRKIETFPLLFPGYVFVFIVSQWWSARYAPGVIDFILDGERPARLPDKVIDELRGRERGGLVVLPEKPQLDPRAGFRMNERLRIKEGAFRGLFIRGASPHLGGGHPIRHLISLSWLSLIDKRCSKSKSRDG